MCRDAKVARKMLPLCRMTKVFCPVVANTRAASASAETRIGISLYGLAGFYRYILLSKKQMDLIKK